MNLIEKDIDREMNRQLSNIGKNNKSISNNIVLSFEHILHQNEVLKNKFYLNIYNKNNEKA